MITDSGNRREFQQGAVRDIADGKGRCDLLPLKEIASLLGDLVLMYIAKYLKTGDIENIDAAVNAYITERRWDIHSAILEVAIHFEEGAKKYNERNWEKGIPCHCFIDSGVRHYLKWLRGDTDENHDRAFLWNMFCLKWTIANKPEFNDLPEVKDDKN